MNFFLILLVITLVIYFSNYKNKSKDVDLNIDNCKCN